MTRCVALVMLPYEERERPRTTIPGYRGLSFQMRTKKAPVAK
jgi:hypothetical protein